MAEEQKDRGPTPPYVSYKTFRTFLRGLHVAIPTRIDKSVMTSMSGGTQHQILQALKYLRLIDPATGVPEQRLAALVKSDGAEHQKVLKEVLEGAYPFLRDKTLDLSKATQNMLDEQFKPLAQGDTLRKCIAFFVPAATEAGIALSPYIKALGKRSPSTKPRKARQAAKSNNDTTDEQPPAPPLPPQVMTWHELLLSKFPSFDPAWPDDVKAKWFENFNHLMRAGDGGNPKP